MDDTAGDEDGLAGLQRDVLAIDAPSCHACEAVDGLVPVLVVVGNWQPRIGEDRHLEHIEAAPGTLLALEKLQFDAAHVYDFWHVGSLSVLVRSSFEQTHPVFSLHEEHYTSAVQAVVWLRDWMRPRM